MLHAQAQSWTMPEAKLEPVAEIDPVPHNDDRAEEIILKYVGVLFHINSDGEIWRIAYMRKGSVVRCIPRRAEYTSKNGYLRVRVMINGVRIRASAHRLVYRFWIGEIPPNAVVNHEDCKRSNNRPTNLKAMSQSDNVHHGGRWKR